MSVVPGFTKPAVEIAGVVEDEEGLESYKGGVVGRRSKSLNCR